MTQAGEDARNAATGKAICGKPETRGWNPRETYKNKRGRLALHVLATEPFLS